MCSHSVYVVFTKGNDQWWTRLLHLNIRHCFIMKPDKGRWIVINKSYQYVDLYTVNNCSDILSSSLVIKVTPKQSKRRLFMLNTCVGLVKQHLGIKAPFVWTPYQLFKRLSRG